MDVLEVDILDEILVVSAQSPQRLTDGSVEKLANLAGQSSIDAIEYHAELCSRVDDSMPQDSLSAPVNFSGITPKWRA